MGSFKPRACPKEHEASMGASGEEGQRRGLEGGNITAPPLAIALFILRSRAGVSKQPLSHLISMFAHPDYLLVYREEQSLRLNGC